jgi:hypothetical protein
MNDPRNFRRDIRQHADFKEALAAYDIAEAQVLGDNRRGQRMGRKPKLTETQQAEARKRRAEGATLAELARSYGVGKSTISRLV